ncbi:MAG: ChaN family lipoprotein [Gemmataceae bacterium]
MTRRIGVVLLALAVCAVRGEGPAVNQAAIEKQLRELEKQIAKVRELEFKSPVVAKVIPRPREGAAGVQGYYDPKQKALFLYDDIKGNYAKGVLVHEMVHALQDQHFGLSKLHAASYDNDRELALAALIEGDATLTMIELLRKEQPFVEKMLLTDLTKAKNLQNAFLYGQGAKFVQAVKQRGGWKAVNQRYQFTPTSTATILHPDQRISPVRLGPGKRIGEYGLIRLLREQPATQPKAVSAAEGWRGDRLIEEKEGTAWVVAFATPEQAKRFYDTLGELRRAEFPKQKIVNDTPTERVWQSESGARRAHYLRGQRIWEISANHEAGHRTLLDRLEGPPKLTAYSVKEKKTITIGELLDRLMEHDLICIGETHDDELHHHVQLALLKSLYARDERLGVGLEMFQRPYQKILDRYISGAIDEETFLEDSDYKKRWGYEWTLYRPIVEFCRRNRIPVAALNLADELRKRLSSVGHEKLTADEKKLIGAIDFQVKAHRDHWFNQLGEMHGHGQLGQQEKEKFYQVMTAWDEYMADSAARFQQERKLRRMVLLAGSGHIERGFGIPDRAKKRTGGKVATVGVAVGGDAAKAAAAPVDFVVIVH